MSLKHRNSPLATPSNSQKQGRHSRQRHSPGAKEEDAPEQLSRQVSGKRNYVGNVNLPTAMAETAAPVVILKPVLAFVARMPRSI